MDKMWMTLGSVFIFIGVLLLIVGMVPGLGRLPGDILIKRENMTFYVPLGTCVLISIVLSVIMYFLNQK